MASQFLPPVPWTMPPLLDLALQREAQPGGFSPFWFGMIPPGHAGVAADTVNFPRSNQLWGRLAGGCDESGFRTQASNPQKRHLVKSGFQSRCIMDLGASEQGVEGVT